LVKLATSFDSSMSIARLLSLIVRQSDIGLV
jgi:hypothetical protein